MFFLRVQDVFLHAVYARRSKRFSCAPLIVATALPISTQNTFFSRVIFEWNPFCAGARSIFFCLNQCVIFDRERRPWEPYFFTTIKAACVAQIYFFLRSLKGQILRQTHGCLVCLGIFFSLFSC